MSDRSPLHKLVGELVDKLDEEHRLDDLHSREPDASEKLSRDLVLLGANIVIGMEEIRKEIKGLSK